MIGMMDGSTSTAAKKDTVMYHSAGKTIEQANHGDSTAGRRSREFTWLENETIVPRSYGKRICSYFSYYSHSYDTL